MQATARLFLTIFVLPILFAMVSLVFPLVLWAAPYGEGTYGGGVYTIGESSSSAAGSSASTTTVSVSTSGCSAQIPVGNADLFQIDRTGQTAKLHFTPVNDHTTGYHVVYGYSEGDERFGGIGMAVQNENDGVQSITINHLNPKHPYFFKVIPTNGCATGEWSNWLKADRVTGRNSIFYRYLPEVVRRAIY